MHKGQFLREFLRHPAAVWAIAESSRELTELITDTADLSQASVVMEFGSGTGVFTEKILEKTSGNATTIVLEVNPNFVEATRRRCPRATVFQDSAVNAAHHLESAGIQQCDRIICGLPWAAFSEADQTQYLESMLRILKPGGQFTTFAYLQGLLLPAGQRFKQKLGEHFSHVERSATVWRNVPPAFAYRCRR